MQGKIGVYLRDQPLSVPAAWIPGPFIPENSSSDGKCKKKVLFGSDLLNDKIYGVMQSAGGDEDYAQLVQRGRQLHDQAVFDLFASLVSKAMLLLKGALRFTIKTQNAGSLYQGAILGQSSKHPA